jgi:dipeptide/tripeptide permease
MPYDARLALRRARRTGVLVCIATVALAALFVTGLARESYWALAIPVAAGVLGVLILAFWIGYTVNTVRGIPTEADHYQGRGARRIALGICTVSVALALLFALGVARESYWALALPVTAAVLGLLAMVFWIGWAIVTQRSTLPAPDAAVTPEPWAAPGAPPPGEAQQASADTHP